MNSTALQKRCSPLTRPVGPDKINRSVTLTLEAEQFLCRLASEVGESVNEFCRRALAMRAEALHSRTALAFRAALTAHTRQRFAAAICLGFVLWIEGNAWATGDQDEFRRTRAKVRVVRVIRVGGRKTEVA